MPIMSCTSGGKKGFKYGEGGVCFTGESARQQAQEVGRAVEAQEVENDLSKSHVTSGWGKGPKPKRGMFV